MSNETEPTEQIAGASSTYDSEFARLQYEQAIETVRSLLTLLIQIITVLVVADATVVGYAVTTQISGILFIGALFPLMVVYVMYLMFRLIAPVMYTAVNTEHRYPELHSHWLVSTLLSVFLSTTYVTKLQKIGSIQEPAERIEQLRKVPSPFMGSGRKITRMVLVLVALGQAVAPAILTPLFHWRLF
jgi:hypothetical protein